jgi:hypothetical protein
MEKEMDAKILEMKYQYELQLEQIRQGGKIETKKEENKGKKSVTKIKMGQPDTDEGMMPALNQMPTLIDEEEEEVEQPEQMMAPQQGMAPEQEEMEEEGEEMEEGEEQ